MHALAQARISPLSYYLLFWTRSSLQHDNVETLQSGSKGGGKMLQIDMLVELTESNAANTTVSERGRAGTLSNP